MAKMKVLALLLAASVAVATPSYSFYLPGIAPVDYPQGAPAEVLAARLTSAKNKVPYSFYSLPLCKLPKGPAHRKRHLNLGQVLVGERAQPTDFQLLMKVDTQCNVLCEFEVRTTAQLRRLHRRITDQYVVRLNLDNMPVVTRLTAAPAGKSKAAPSFMLGYPLGVSDTSGAAYLYNHLRLRVLYHEPALTDVAAAAAAASAAAAGTERVPAYRIVGFEVEPMSVAHKVVDGKVTTCPVNGSATAPLAVPLSRAGNAAGPAIASAMTYDVEWVRSNRAWATRWDALLNANSAQVQIQWFSVVNSVRTGGIVRMAASALGGGGPCLTESCRRRRFFPPVVPLGAVAIAGHGANDSLVPPPWLFCAHASRLALFVRWMTCLVYALALFLTTGDDCAVPGRHGGPYSPPDCARRLCALQPPGRG